MKKLFYVCLLFQSSVCYSARITHSDYTSATTITASGQNANENAIVNEMNGNLDNTNLAAAGVLGSNIAAGTIVGSNIAGATITGSKIAPNTIGDGNIIASTITNLSIASGTIRGANNNSSGAYNEIAMGTVSTIDLKAMAVTNPVQGYIGSVASDQSIIITSASITTIGGNVMVIAQA